MSGLYGTLNLGTRALQTQSQGLSVAGQNLANVNNPAYSRQRLVVQTASPISTPLGSEGAGITAVSIQRVRDTLLDRQIQTESSAAGFWSAQQTALRSAQLGLGQALDGNSGRADGTASTPGIAGSSGLATGLSALFEEFQNLAASPASLPQRATLLSRARALADEFNRTDERLAGVEDTLNRSVSANVDDANQLLGEIARLNEQVRRAESGNPGSANDLRDRRQQKLEAFARLSNVDATEEADGQLTLAVAGEILVSGRAVVTPLVAHDPGDGRLRIRTGTGIDLKLTGGSIQGTIDARDGTLADLRSDLDRLASALATEVNTVHRGGFNLAGGSGADFFVGTKASDFRVNPALANDPSLVQAGANPAASGDNQVAVALARLADQPVAALGGRTFSGAFAATVAAAGESLAHANSQIEDQQLVDNLLLGQRNAISGVSIDEEMADLLKFEKAFQASARIVSIVDQMLDEIIQLKR